MKFLRYILFPFVPVYYLVTWLRNKFYDLNILKSKSYNFPVICVGNLSVGGTGKSPMIEYLIKLLNSEYHVATLSRGYKRKTNGFLLANLHTDVAELGDEPYQFKHKFNNILVAVDEDRQNGIKQLVNIETPPDVILLDDAYQHRKVKAGFNILLTTYANLYVNDVVLPTGNLREPRSGANRAQVILVTKCPITISEAEKSKILNKLGLTKNQHLFFSWIDYSKVFKNEEGEALIEDFINKNLTIVTGIANPNPLIDFLKSKNLDFEHLNYKDHYNFTEKDVAFLNKKELIITTEKDYVRLKGKLENASLYYLPIELKIDDSQEFENALKTFVTSF